MMKRFFVYAALLIVGALGTTVLVTSAIAQETTETPTIEATATSDDTITPESTGEATSDGTLTGSETPATDPTADAAFNQTNQPQDVGTGTPTAAPQATREPALDIDLETLTADPSLFVGQVVTLEGVVENLVNMRAFVLGEGVVLDNDQILVVNASGQELDIRVTDGARFRITGRVYNSFADGGLTQLVANIATTGELMSTEEAPMIDMTVTPTAEMAMPDATDEAGNVIEGGGGLQPIVIPYTTSLADMVVPDALFGFTIVEITRIDDVVFLELP
jgi:hypothetical protein